MKSKMLKYFATLCMIAPYIALSADGLALHQENCIACHAAMTGGDGSLLYTRKDNKIKSSEALTKQINRCQSSLELNWTANQISTVHEYLNSAFYKF